MEPLVKAGEGKRAGGFFYLVAGSVNNEIYATNSDCVASGILLAEAAGNLLEDGQPGPSVHAYGIDRRWIRVVVETTSDESPLAAFRRVTGRGAELVASSGRPLGTAGPLDVRRFVSLVGRAEFLAAVRHCHMSPVPLYSTNGLPVRRPDSHHAYTGQERIYGLTRSTVARVLSVEAGGWPVGYCQLMQPQTAGQAVVQLLSMDVPILPRREDTGDLSCLTWLRRNHIASQKQYMFEQTVESVCEETCCDSFDFRKHPSTPNFKLQRALVVHRLKESRVMSVKEVVTRLGIDRSWSYHTYRECLKEFPEAFQHSGESTN